MNKDEKGANDGKSEESAQPAGGTRTNTVGDKKSVLPLSTQIPKQGKGHGVLKTNWSLSRNFCSELE